ncbi:GvpL/GvpF family gas vesicle protein [Candidatus Parcubacteria bacterium]|nr:GvpL/GvpF family gas vesicle protein [Patescibacteria group bacterium]MBU4466675.1 GvpL/GvpF family gas vesicle protein [Patescibacteria group bacterium]MCG2688342.1 GvpL/GvpF family gas vesicle protein [Candidatus Parcubacteria bacterium]
MAKNGKYLYCVIKEKDPKKFGILGQGGNEVYAINEGDLAIAVSDSPKEEYSFIKDHLTCHQKVIEEVMGQGYDVLPVRFGTVAKSREHIKEKILKSKRKELLETFPIVEGRIELGLRAFWKDMPSIFQEIVAEDKEIQIAKKQVQGNPVQLNIARVGEMVEKALEVKRENEAQKILDPLKKLAVDFKPRELLKSREIMKDSMICSSAFLVAKEKEKEFDQRIRALIKEHDKRIKFIYIGPIPPFNFVELHLTV